MERSGIAYFKVESCVLNIWQWRDAGLTRTLPARNSYRRYLLVSCRVVCLNFYTALFLIVLISPLLDSFAVFGFFLSLVSLTRIGIDYFSNNDNGDSTTSSMNACLPVRVCQ